MPEGHPPEAGHGGVPWAGGVLRGAGLLLGARRRAQAVCCEGKTEAACGTSRCSPGPHVESPPRHRQEDVRAQFAAAFSRVDREPGRASAPPRPAPPRPPRPPQDMDQLVYNCLLYNPVGSAVRGLGQKLEQRWLDNWRRNPVLNQFQVGRLLVKAPGAAADARQGQGQAGVWKQPRLRATWCACQVELGVGWAAVCDPVSWVGAARRPAQAVALRSSPAASSTSACHLAVPLQVSRQPKPTAGKPGAKSRGGGAASRPQRSGGGVPRRAPPKAQGAAAGRVPRTTSVNSYKNYQALPAEQQARGAARGDTWRRWGTAFVRRGVCQSSAQPLRSLPAPEAAPATASAPLAATGRIMLPGLHAGSEPGWAVSQAVGSAQPLAARGPFAAGGAGRGAAGRECAGCQNGRRGGHSAARQPAAHQRGGRGGAGPEVRTAGKHSAPRPAREVCPAPNRGPVPGGVCALDAPCCLARRMGLPRRAAHLPAGLRGPHAAACASRPCSVLSPGVVWELYEFVMGRPPPAAQAQPARSSFQLQEVCVCVWGGGGGGVGGPAARWLLVARAAGACSLALQLLLWVPACASLLLLSGPCLPLQDSDYDPYGEEEED